MKPNRKVTMIFEEVPTDEKDILALKIFLDAPDRPLDEEWCQCDDPTLAEVWAVEAMAFVEDFMKRQMMDQDVNGYVMTAPKKSEMN